MNTKTKDFHLGDILTVTTGRMLSPDNVHSLIDLIAFMTNSSAQTLQTLEIQPFKKQCRSSLIAQHPQLEGPEIELALKELDEQIKLQGVESSDRNRALAMNCVDKLAAKFGTYLPVNQIEGEEGK